MIDCLFLFSLQVTQLRSCLIFLFLTIERLRAKECEPRWGVSSTLKCLYLVCQHFRCGNLMLDLKLLLYYLNIMIHFAYFYEDILNIADLFNFFLYSLYNKIRTHMVFVKNILPTYLYDTKGMTIKNFLIPLLNIFLFNFVPFRKPKHSQNPDISKNDIIFYKKTFSNPNLSDLETPFKSFVNDDLQTKRIQLRYKLLSFIIHLSKYLLIPNLNYMTFDTFMQFMLEIIAPWIYQRIFPFLQTIELNFSLFCKQLGEYLKDFR